MSEEEDGGDMGRLLLLDGVLFIRPTLPLIPDVPWMLDRVPVMGEDDSNGVTGPVLARETKTSDDEDEKNHTEDEKRPYQPEEDHIIFEDHNFCIFETICWWTVYNNTGVVVPSNI